MTGNQVVTVKVGARVTSNTDLAYSGVVVAEPVDGGYPCDPDMFVIATGPASDPWFTFGRLTGRTRRRWGYVDCPTVERFAVDTIARDGVILGVPGRRLPGTWFVRPVDVAEVTS